MAHHSHDSGHAADAEHASSEHAEHGSYSTYIGVFFALLALTVISLVTANAGLPPRVMWAGMMAVSCAKALLVMLFFMHLKWEANWKYVLTIPASIMSVFLVLMLIPDVGQRMKMYAEERFLHASDTAFHPGHHDDHAGHKEHGAKADHAAGAHAAGEH
jgi:cytochrome c oxidase subunit 4